MSIRQKSGSGRSRFVKSNVVIVAVKACEEISRSPLAWALTNVVHPGDCVKLLVVIPSHTLSKKLWGLTNFHSDCTAGYWSFMSGTMVEQKEYITDLCNQMMCHLHDIYDSKKVIMKMKIVYESKDGVVASEAKRAKTQWVVLDKQVQKEANFCMEQLDCNIITVKKSEPKILQLNLIESRKVEAEVLQYSRSTKKLDAIKVPNVTPTSSPDRISSTSSLDMIMSPSFISQINWEPKVKHIPSGNYGFDATDSESDSDVISSLSTIVSTQQGMEDNLSPTDDGVKNLREKISLNKEVPPDSPPLCSVCRDKTPSFGKPPMFLSYAELEQATNGFSEANFLAEGGYGSVYRGTLPNGQVIAVKKHKSGSSQGYHEFSSEVQVLSCAQHRNVVMLIGYCVEGSRRLLVYEYICNGSLDSHLYGRDRNPLDWAARQKVAIGAARGLRYLHEECRVGCIIHRDMRPNNILLTHDFEPLVGDFGLARLKSDGESRVGSSRIIGTFGYLAPEFAQCGQVSEKSDVYSFGVVLLELVTGRKAVDIYRPKGEQCLTEWARPLLEENALSKHVDPCLNNCYLEKEVEAMLHCASLCLRRDPPSRPTMSQVVRMLEGDISMR